MTARPEVPCSASMNSAAASSTRFSSSSVSSVSSVPGSAGLPVLSDGKAVWDSPSDAVPITSPPSSASSTVSSTKSSHGWNSSRATTTTTSSTLPMLNQIAFLRLIGHLSSGQQQRVEPPAHDEEAHDSHHQKVDDRHP